MIWGPMNTKIMSIKISVGLAFLFLCSCSSGNGDGVIALVVKNAASPAGLSAQSIPSVLQADTFRVTISAPDLSPPLVVTFPGTAVEGQVTGIPVGENRTVLIEAINASGQVVRRRQLPGITISGDRPTPVVASLLSVPLVTNIPNNGLVTQTRLVFKGYAEPGSGLEITDAPPAGSSSVLTDINDSETMISPSLSDGGFTFQPSLLALGLHTFTITDLSSGEKSQITVTVVRAGRQPGLGFNVAGSIKPLSIESTGNSGMFSKALNQMQQSK